MKSNKLVFIFSWLFTILSVSCAQSAISSPTPTRLPLNPPTSSTVPEPTVSPTPMPSSTFTPSPTNTPTASSTLPWDAARARLLDLLAKNGNCSLPCLWGISPGRSTYREAEAILTPLSSISGSLFTGFFNEKMGSILLYYIEGDLMLDVVVKYIVENQVVSLVYFEAKEEKKIIAKNGEPGISNIYDSSIFSERILPYTLSRVLSQLGMPASVMVSTYGAPDNVVGGFDIVLLYPDQGFLIDYTTQMYKVGQIVRGCPASAHVKIRISPPGHSDSFVKSLADTQWAKLWPSPPNDLFWRPIDQATTMSLEEFYETFRKPTNQCLETSATLWYVLESGGG